MQAGAQLDFFDQRPRPFVIVRSLLRCDADLLHLLERRLELLLGYEAVDLLPWACR